MTTRTEKNSLPQVDEKALDAVTGGTTRVGEITIPKSHACTSGQDPKTRDPIFSSVLVD